MSESDIFERMRKLSIEIIPPGGSVWLYGSRARGTAHEDSDWDLLILLDKDSVDATDYQQIARPFTELGWAVDALIVPQIYTHKEWDQMSYMPYYKNVVQDKRVVL